MNLSCLLLHHWNGCRCERCGTVRDQDHDWHYCRCARCGLTRSEHHDWHGCVCSVCRTERHCWIHGVCAQCGLVCDHVPQPGVNPDSYSELTAHESMSWRCSRCGVKVPVDRQDRGTHRVKPTSEGEQPVRPPSLHDCTAMPAKSRVNRQAPDRPGGRKVSQVRRDSGST